MLLCSESSEKGRPVCPSEERTETDRDYFGALPQEQTWGQIVELHKDVRQPTTKPSIYVGLRLPGDNRDQKPRAFSGLVIHLRRPSTHPSTYIGYGSSGELISPLEPRTSMDFVLNTRTLDCPFRLDVDDIGLGLVLGVEYQVGAWLEDKVTGTIGERYVQDTIASWREFEFLSFCRFCQQQYPAVSPGIRQTAVSETARNSWGSSEIEPLRREQLQGDQSHHSQLAMVLTNHRTDDADVQGQGGLGSSTGDADELPSFDIVGISHGLPRSLLLTLWCSHQIMAKVLERTSGQLLALLQQELDQDESEVESE